MSTVTSAATRRPYCSPEPNSHELQAGLSLRLIHAMRDLRQRTLVGDGTNLMQSAAKPLDIHCENGTPLLTT